jgi:hypothetical protein
MAPTKFTLQFLDIPLSLYKFWKFELFFANIHSIVKFEKRNKKEKPRVGQIRPEAEGLLGLAAYYSGRLSQPRGLAGPVTRGSGAARQPTQHQEAPWRAPASPPRRRHDGVRRRWGQVLGGQRRHNRSLAPQGEREEGEGGPQINGRRHRLAAHREGKRRQRLSGNRRGVMGSGIRGG